MKKLLLAASLLIMTSFVNAQYLVSATQIAYISDFYVKQGLDNQGYDTESMELNSMRLYKITYNTIDVHGEPTIASGAVYVPQIDCDTLPMISYQHGTVFDTVAVPSNWYSWPGAYLFSGNGYITTLPDYLGLGDNPGLHPYVHWESEATASIDLIRAVREFLNEDLNKCDNNQLFLTGYSQGGHSTMAIHKYITVNNLQDEFNVVASAPLSGAFPLYDAQFPEMFGGDVTYYRAEFVPYALASYQLVYGNLYSDYSEYYDPPYDSIIPDWLESGIHWAGEWAALIPDNFYDFMQDSVVDNMKSNPNHPVNVDLRKNDLHNWIPQEPVRMLYCGLDSMVYAQNSIMANDTMNAMGAPDVQAIDMDPSGIHETCYVPTTTYALEWFDSLRLEDCEMVHVSIASFKQDPEINLYPNPVTDIATFSSEKITSIEIYNMLGALIIRRDNNKVDMSGLKSGMYFVIGFDNKNVAIYKGRIIKD